MKQKQYARMIAKRHNKNHSSPIGGPPAKLLDLEIARISEGLKQTRRKEYGKSLADTTWEKRLAEPYVR